MKIISLSLDNSVLDKDSQLAKRTVEYGNLVEKYLVVVHSNKNAVVDLSNKTQVCGIGVSNKFIGLYKIYYSVKNILSKEKYDLITVQDQYYLALIGLLLARKFHLGLEVQVHGFEKYYGLRKLIAKFIIPKASAVRTVSQRMKKRLIDEFGVKKERITVAPIFVDTGNFPPETDQSLAEKFEKRDKFIFLTVGRLVSVKNIEMQIRAMAGIDGKQQTADGSKMRVELWIVGDGPEMGNLSRYASGEIARLATRQENLGLENNVKLFGWQDDLVRFYKQADAFLLTSDSEGWGMAVIEAASYGLPIIMTDVGCAGEVVKDGESGVVIPVRDQKKLEEAMIKIIQGSELRKKLGENARQAVLKLPRKEETLELYKKSWEKAMEFNN